MITVVKSTLIPERKIEPEKKPKREHHGDDFSKILDREINKLREIESYENRKAGELLGQESKN